jgi:3-methyladenine DNA glycosylase AlkD
MLNDEMLVLVNELEEALVQAAHPDRAQAMAAYMKNHFGFIGIPKPQRAAIQKPFFKALQQTRCGAGAFLEHCWQKKEREWHYAGMDYALGNPKLQEADFLSQLEMAITTHSWWDTVDLLASRGLGPWLKKNPALEKPTIARWRQHPNLWLNRSCLLYQLHYGQSTDFELLKSLCLDYASTKEFFIQKAMGWALRHYARTNAAGVVEFVTSHALPSLSKREALKHFEASARKLT